MGQQPEAHLLGSWDWVIDVNYVLQRDSATLSRYLTF